MPTSTEDHTTSTGCSQLGGWWCDIGWMDEWQWLEDLDAARALRWVRERNAETITTLAGGEQFAQLQMELRQVRDDTERIPYPGWRGDGFYYNFWRDAKHPRGLWRRTTLEQYRRQEPQWDVLLDLDTLAAEEQEPWVWAGAAVRRPDYERCLISLSRGGADAVVVREFDLHSRVFVEDGFTLPEAKSDICWIDHDQVYVGTDEGPGSLTTPPSTTSVSPGPIPITVTHTCSPPVGSCSRRPCIRARLVAQPRFSSGSRRTSIRLG